MYKYSITFDRSNRIRSKECHAQQMSWGNEVGGFIQTSWSTSYFLRLVSLRLWHASGSKKVYHTSIWTQANPICSTFFSKTKKTLVNFVLKKWTLLWSLTRFGLVLQANRLFQEISRSYNQAKDRRSGLSARKTARLHPSIPKFQQPAVYILLLKQSILVHR